MSLLHWKILSMTSHLTLSKSFKSSQWSKCPTISSTSLLLLPLLLPLFLFNSKEVGTQVILLFFKDKILLTQGLCTFSTWQEHPFPRSRHDLNCHFYHVFAYKTENTQPTSSHTLSCFISPALFSPSGVQCIYLLSTPFRWNVKSTWK